MAKKVALLHDALCVVGGAERVFQYMCEAFPEADIYTLAYKKDATLPYFGTRRVRTTWLNPMVRSRLAFKLAFPLATFAMERLDLRAYDLVLTSSATVAKYARAENGKHVCYCYMPTRALWHFNEYFGTGAKARLIKLALPYLRARDLAAARRVDEFISISAMTQRYIREFYGRESRILPSPIDLTLFGPRGQRSDHYLVVSRLEYWKHVDYAIEAFNRLKLPLRVIGTGPDEARLRRMAGPTISFLGGVNDEQLADEYARARAVVFTPYLEYGLIPLEANASGTPVLGFGEGGIKETMIPARESAERATAVFFDRQTPEALIEAIRKFDRLAFDSEFLIKHASQWSVPVFQSRLRKAVQQSIPLGELAAETEEEALVTQTP